MAWRLLAFRAFLIVLIDGCLFKIYSCYVSKGCEPCDDVCKFSFSRFHVFFFKSFPQFVEFVLKPIVSSFYSAFRISVKVYPSHHLLKLVYMHCFPILTLLSMQ